MLSPKEFLTRVLPPPKKDVYYCAVDITDKKVRHFFVSTLEELHDKGKEISDNGGNAYFALSTFDGTNSEFLKSKSNTKKENGVEYSLSGRKQSFTKEIKCLFLDIDVGKENNSYADLKKAESELKDFCAKVKMPKPIVNRSGNGLHVYWDFEKELDTNEWRQLATDFVELCKEHKLVIDPAVPLDSARILRIPGTTHQSTETFVSNIVVGEVNSFDTYRKIIPASNVTAKIIPKDTEFDQASRTILEGSESKFKTILELAKKGLGCNQIKLAYEKPNDVPYEVWLGILCVMKPCSDWEEMLDEMCGGYEGYNKEENIKKIHSVNKPQFCNTFAMQNPDGCKGCPVKGLVTTPVQTGSVNNPIQVNEETPKIKETDAFTGTKSEFERPKLYPTPYVRRNNGVYKRVVKPGEEGAEDEVTFHQVYENDIYAVELYKDQKYGSMIGLRLHLPMEGVETFMIALSDMTSKEKLRGELAKNGVAASPAQMNEIMSYLISWVSFLQKNRKAQMTFQQMGFSKDRSSFLIGQRLYTAGGIKKAPNSGILEQHYKRFAIRGSVDKWGQAINRLFGRKGEEARRFAFGLGFGSPFYTFSKHDGILLNLRGKAGLNKTATLLCINSIWGDPEELMMMGTDTANSIINRFGQLQSFPLTIDEFTNVDPKFLSSFVYTVSGGQGKNRLVKDENQERINDINWKAPAISTANADFEDKLSSAKEDPEAELIRMLQLEVFSNGLDDEENGDLVSQVIDNCGTAAEPYITWMLGNMGTAKDIFDSYVDKISKDAQLTSKERFWKPMAASVLSGLHAGNELKLFNLDIKSLYDWLVPCLIDKKINYTNTNISSAHHIGTFLNDNVNNMLVISGAADKRIKDSEPERELPLVTPKAALNVRVETDTKNVYSSVNSLKKWCSERQISYSTLIADLVNSGIIEGSGKSVLARLGKGWATTAQVSCVVLNGRKLDLDIEELQNAAR